MNPISLALVLILVPVAAQDPAPKISAQSLYQQVMQASQSVTMPKERTREAMSEYRKARMQAISKAADKALGHADLFATGDGLHFKGMILNLAGKREDATAAFVAHAEANPQGDLAHASMLLVANASRYTDADRSLQLADKIDRAKLDEGMQRSFDGLARWASGYKLRTALTGQVAPAWTSQHVIGGASDEISSAACKGKVTVIDFWATWCGPCRQVIPDLVKMQAHHGDKIQVLGLTRFYGYGSDFAGGAKIPHGGKTVGSRDQPLSEDAELAINRTFAQAFDLNYPLVFVDKSVASEHYGVQGIPTVYVIDAAGKIVGHVVGSGPANHAKLEAMIAAALGGPAEAAGKKRDGH